MDIDAFKMIDLSESLSMKVYKIVGVPQPLRDEFIPAQHIYLDRIDHVDWHNLVHEQRFWNGEAAELKEYEAKAAAKVAAEARRKERQAAGERSRAAPERRDPQRRQQPAHVERRKRRRGSGDNEPRMSGVLAIEDAAVASEMSTLAESRDDDDDPSDTDMSEVSSGGAMERDERDGYASDPNGGYSPSSSKGGEKRDKQLASLHAAENDEPDPVSRGRVCGFSREH